MAGVRIRWRGVARVAAIVLVALLAVRLLPGFLRAPEPPPLAANVGLPRAEPVEAPGGGAARPGSKTLRRGAAPPVTDVPRRRPSPAATHPRKHRRRPRPRRSRPRPVRDAPASEATIGSRRKHRIKQEGRPHAGRDKVSEPGSSPEEVTEPAPPPAPEYVPPAIPEPVPAPLPEPSPEPPSTPGDGSQEFAPH
jgi:hypothetical protein